MKNFRRVMCAFLIVGMIGSGSFASFAESVEKQEFTADGETGQLEAPIDIQYDWAADDIYTLMNHGIMNGFEDERFRPTKNISRAELCQVMYNMYNQKQEAKSEVSKKNKQKSDLKELTELEAEAAVSEFSDTLSKWAVPAVSWAVSNGVMSVYEDGSFGQDIIVDRTMFAVSMYNYLQAEGYVFDEAREFALTDISEEDFAYEAVRIMYEDGILNGYEDGTFRGSRLVSRNEVACMVRKLSEFEVIDCPRTLPEYSVLDVPYFSQIWPVYAPVGCEAVSMFMGLRYKDCAMDIELRPYLEQLPRHSSNPAKGFVGSPFEVDRTKTLRTTIFPKKLADYGSLYGDVKDISGQSVEAVRAEVLAGNPVVAYCTMWWEKPFYRTYNVEGEEVSMLSNNHVILVCGYNRETNEYYIADPYNYYNIGEDYKYWIDGWTFENRWNERQHAVAVR